MNLNTEIRNKLDGIKDACIEIERLECAAIVLGHDLLASNLRHINNLICDLPEEISDLVHSGTMDELNRVNAQTSDILSALVFPKAKS